MDFTTQLQKANINKKLLTLRSRIRQNRFVNNLIASFLFERHPARNLLHPFNRLLIAPGDIFVVAQREIHRLAFKWAVSRRF